MWKKVELWFSGAGSGRGLTVMGQVGNFGGDDNTVYTFLQNSLHCILKMGIFCI